MATKEMAIGDIAAEVEALREAVAEVEKAQKEQRALFKIDCNKLMAQAMYVHTFFELEIAVVSMKTCFLDTISSYNSSLPLLSLEKTLADVLSLPPACFAGK